MGKVIVTEELVNKEFEESIVCEREVDISRIFELIVSAKEIDT